jgi:ferrous iron transport protein B
VIDAVAAIEKTAEPLHIDYQEMEPALREMVDRLATETSLSMQYPLRWLAIKLMESDEEVLQLIGSQHPQPDAFMAMVDQGRTTFEKEIGNAPEVHIATCRYKAADTIARACLQLPKGTRRPLSDKFDDIVCHRFFGPVFLVGIIWLLYYLAIVQGYNITNYTWPLLAKLRSLTEAVTPEPGFIDIPLIREFSLWIVDSVNALLNYIPIFFILFAFIAILEDSGYMPRMAFIMDRLFSRYGLHGQSTLPMVLGVIYVGGCAVPGVMSCKGIPDERSRLATILIIPLLNCLAKVPLYVLLINIYFAAHKAWAMFFISTISLLMVLPVAKILTLNVLKDKETAPFVIEMPPYHLPTCRGVLSRAVERVWLFMRKISTIVVAVAVVVFVLLQFPGVGQEHMEFYDAEKDKAVAVFYKKNKRDPLFRRTPGGSPHGDGALMGSLQGGQDGRRRQRGVGDGERRF